MPGLALVLLILTLTVRPAGAEVLLFRGGHIVDPSARQVRVEDVLVRNGRIAERGASLSAPEARTIDATGLWILPGLHDLHVHGSINQAPGDVYERLGHEETARRMLYAGVTGFLDLFSDEREVFAARARLAEAGPGAAGELFAAGPCLTAPKGHCTEYPTPTRTLTSPEQARSEIADLAASEPDVVKLVYTHLDEELKERSFRPEQPTLDFATLEAAARAARERGIPTVVHIRGWADIADAVRAGVSAVTHLPSHGPVPEGLAERLAEQGVAVIPTLSRGDIGWVTVDDFFDDPLLRSLAADRIIQAYREARTRSEEGRSAGMVRGLRRAEQARFEALRELAEAGVTLLTGTDSGNWFTLQGFSLHRELELWVRAGLDPWTVLAAATVDAGEFLGRDWGVEVGDEASLLILDASPLEDIRNTRRIHAVIHRGVVVERKAPEPTAVHWPRRP